MATPAKGPALITVFSTADEFRVLWSIMTQTERNTYSMDYAARAIAANLSDAFDLSKSVDVVYYATANKFTLEQR